MRQQRNSSSEQDPYSALVSGHLADFMIVCPLARMTRRSVVNLTRFGSRAFTLLYGKSLRPLHTSLCQTSQPKTGFKPEKVAVVTKTTRYEFEQQRYRYAGLSEDDLKQLVRGTFVKPIYTLPVAVCSELCCVCVLQLAMKGSSYSGLLERHNIHTNNVEHIVNSLRYDYHCHTSQRHNEIICCFFCGLDTY